MTHLKDKIKIIDRKLLSDNRGYFLKIITGKEEGLPNYTGEIYVTLAKPGEKRGGHYHLKANEWFTLLQGECALFLEDVNTKEKLSIELFAPHPKTIFVPPYIAHVFTNTSVSNDFLLLAYTDQLYNPADTIPY